MASVEYTRGQNITINPVPPEIRYFLLAQEFNWTPEQVDRQDHKKLKGLLHVLQTHNKIKNDEIKRENAKRKGKR